MPSVSIILPTFNRTRFLEPAVASVYAQTHKDWELIIADDGSTERTKAYLRSVATPRMRTIWLAHSGNPSRVRNAAIAAASGRYLAFLDSDDVWAPEKLAKQIAALRERADGRWSHTTCDHIDENGRPLERKGSGEASVRDGWIFEPLLRLEVAIAMPTVVADRDLVCEVGRFDEQLHFGEFHDLCLRLSLRSEVVALRESLCSIRVHNEHYSADRVAANISWMRLYEKIGDLAPSAHLRFHCAQMRAHTSLTLARLQSDAGDHRGVWTTLRRASLFSYRYPRWWWGALKSVGRLAVRKVSMAS